MINKTILNATPPIDPRNPHNKQTIANIPTAASVSSGVPPIGFAGSFAYDGSRGYTGSRGYSGSNGFLGSRGLAGYTGSIGFAGSRGYAGSKGDTAYVGSRGIRGLDGYTGSIGFTGSQGFFGSKGYTGSIGAGYTGSAGADGYTGSIGSGYTGSASTAIGYTPLTANVSRTVTASANISFPVNITGNLTAFGVGQRVRAANVFANIVNGIEGTISSFSSNIMYVLADTAIGSGTFPRWVITAAPGPVGFAGSAGGDGTIGVDGYTGSAGGPGEKGYTGSVGGGYTGSLGYAGSQGFFGSKGFTGSAGAGYNGSHGYTGSFSFGFAGSRGFFGSTGYWGSTGYSGSAGSFTFGNLTTSRTSMPGQVVLFTSNTTSNSSGSLQIEVKDNEVSFALPTSMKLIETVVTTANVVANLALVTSNIGNISSNITPDWAVGSVYSYTLKTNANVFIPNNMPIGSAMTLVFTQDTIGSRTITPKNSFTGNAGNIVVGTYFFAGNIRTLSTAANTIDMMNIVRVTSTQYLAALSLGYK